MNKTAYKLLLSYVSLLLLLGCEKNVEEENRIPLSNIEVSFNSVISRVTDLNWDANDRIGVFMYLSGSGLSEESVVNSVPACYVYQNGAFCPEGEEDRLFYPVEEHVDFVAYYHSGQDSTSLADNEVHSLCVDRSRRLWVGTANGLQCYVPENDAFRLVTFQGVSLKGRIHDIIQLDNGDIVCVVANVGIFRVDAQTMQGYPLWVESDVFTPGNSYSLFEDSRKRLWIGTDREGVVCVDLDSHMERRYASSFSTVNDMVEGHDGCMYVVSPQGVFRRDEPSDRFFPLSYDGDGEGMLCQTAMQTKDGHLLVATYGHGCFA